MRASLWILLLLTRNDLGGGFRRGDESPGESLRIISNGQSAQATLWYNLCSRVLHEENIMRQPITVNLPDDLYQQVARRAQRMQSSLEDELVAVVASALSADEALPATTLDALAQLAYLHDDELWQATQVMLSPDENTQMQYLLQKRQAEGLTQIEQAETQRLLQRYDYIMLVRAQAIALLHTRGHNVSTLLQPPLPQ